jgi:hypothetical protein
MIQLNTYKATEILQAYKGYSPTAGDLDRVLVNCRGDIIYDDPGYGQEYRWQTIGRLEADGRFKITAEPPLREKDLEELRAELDAMSPEKREELRELVKPIVCRFRRETKSKQSATYSTHSKS